MSGFGFSPVSVKAVVVGNTTVGKTTLIGTFAEGRFRPEYHYNLAFNRIIDLMVDGKPVELSPWDTVAHEDYDRLRYRCYPDTDVLLLCFSLACHQSYDDITTKWYPELKRFCPDTPIILVATKLDLREDQEVAEDLKQQTGRDLISISDGVRLMLGNPNVVRYMECSAITQSGVEEVFEEAARVTIQRTKQTKNCTIM